jgi:hypothetical protein
MTRAPILVTDLTRMQGERICLAGYRLDVDPPTCVRPLFANGHLTERWLFDGDEAIVRPRAVVELDLLGARPDPPHVEDWHVHPRVRRQVRMAAADELGTLLERIADASVAAIFGAPIRHDNGWYLPAGTGERSLGAVRAVQVLAVGHAFREDRRTWGYRMAFTDATGEEYRLAVTDLAFRHYLDHLREPGTGRAGLSAAGAAGRLTTALRRAKAVYLRIGLTRGWEQFPDRCFLQVTGVYSFPDYLAGRCHADFLPEPPSARWRLPLDEVPF